MSKILVVLTLLFSVALAKESNKVEYEHITLSKDNHISFNQRFDAMTVAKKSKELYDLALVSKKDTFYIVVNSPGGSVTYGQQFNDLAKGLGKKVHTITIFSASMGYNTVQSLGTRYILPNGELMSHRGFVSGISGQIPGELNSRVSMINNSLKSLNKIAADRIGITVEEYKKLIHDEFWIRGEAAVKLNHADKIALVKCDESLSGTETMQFFTLFGPVDVEFSKCPIITGPLDVSRANEEARKEVFNYFNNLRDNVYLEF